MIGRSNSSRVRPLTRSWQPCANGPSPLLPSSDVSPSPRSPRSVCGFCSVHERRAVGERLSLEPPFSMSAPARMAGSALLSGATSAGAPAKGAIRACSDPTLRAFLLRRMAGESIGSGRRRRREVGLFRSTGRPTTWSTAHCLVSTKGGQARVIQLDVDLSNVKPDKQSFEALAENQPQVAQFIAEASGRK